MLRGIHKKMIVVKTPPASPFECAYFILKNNAPEETREDKHAMLHEAQRILSENQPDRAPSRSRVSTTHARSFGFLLFLLGFLSGALLFCLLWATL